MSSAMRDQVPAVFHHDHAARTALDAGRFGVALTAAASALYAVCALAVTVAPEWTFAFLGTWFHGIDLTLLRPAGDAGPTPTSFVVGWIALVVVALPFGALLAWTYNALGARAARAASLPITDS